MTNAPITFRPARPDDALCLGVLSTQVFLHTYTRHGIRPALAREVLANHSVACYEKLLADPRKTILVAECDAHMIALSLVLQPDSGRHFATAARVATELVLRVQRAPLHQATILNVNVPDVPYEALKGYQATRLGFRHRSERIIAAEDPRGRPVYWVGPAGVGQDAGPGTDFHAVANNYVSVTPLQIDLTRHSMLEDMRAWLQGRAS